jgi:hypothetical protein
MVVHKFCDILLLINASIIVNKSVKRAHTKILTNLFHQNMFVKINKHNISISMSLKYLIDSTLFECPRYWPPGRYSFILHSLIKNCYKFDVYCKCCLVMIIKLNLFFTDVWQLLESYWWLPARKIFAVHIHYLRFCLGQIKKIVVVLVSSGNNHTFDFDIPETRRE